MIESTRVKGVGISTSEEVETYERQLRSLREEIAAVDPADLLGRVDLLCKVGRLQESTAHDDEALASYRDAIHILDRLGEAAAKGQLLHTCGLIEARLGRLRNAQQAFADAQEIFAQSGDRDLLACVHLDRGVLLGRSSQLSSATAALTTAAKGFAELDEALGQGHAHFFLAQFEGAANPDRARWNLDRARMFYQKWLQDNPYEEGIRIAAPQAPESVGDPRQFSVDELIAYCDLRCEELAAQAARRNSTEGEEAAKGTVVPPNQTLRILGVLVAAAAFGVAFPALWIHLGIAMIEPQIFHLAVAAATAVGAFAGMLYVGVDSRMVQLLAPLLPCMLAYEVNSTGMFLPASLPGVRVAEATQSATKSTDSGGAPRPAALSMEEYIDTAEAAFADNPEAARDMYSTAAVDFAKANDQISRAAALVQAVNLDRQIGDGDSQREHLRQLVDAHVQSNNSQAEMMALRELAAVESIQGRTTGSIATYLRIAEIASQAGTKSDSAAALLAAARASRSTGDLERASALLNQAEGVLRGLGDETGLGDVAMERGRISAVTDPLTASRLFLAAQEHYRKGRNPAQEAAALIELAGVDLKLDRRIAARRNLEEATQRCQRAEDRACEARTLIAMAPLTGGAAGTALTAAVAAARASGNRSVEIQSLLHLASAEAARGHRDAAHRAHADALAACDKIADPKQQADAFLAVGTKAEAMNLPDRAREAYAEALRMYEQVRNRPGQIAALRRMQVLAQAADSVLAERYAGRIAHLEEETRRDG